MFTEQLAVLLHGNEVVIFSDSTSPSLRFLLGVACH